MPSAIGSDDMDRDAHILREGTGTAGVLDTARLAASKLADHDIPHLIIGGVAVQEHGYPRVTIDVDIVVPDVLDAVELLAADLSRSFVKVAGVDDRIEDRIEDRRNGVCIDLLPADRVVKSGCQVPFPKPTRSSEELQIVGLEQLISLKLDSAANSPLRRLRDKTDVVELITRRNLPRTLAVAEPVRKFYLELWDGIQAEPR